MNNFDRIKHLLEFSSGDDFYFLQILQRKKEHPELGSNSRVIKTYYINNISYLEGKMEEIIKLCDFFRARAYINPNRRSYRKLALQTIRKIADQMSNEEYSHVANAYDSVCGAYSNEPNRKWVVDIDEKSIDVVDECIKVIEDLQPLGKPKIYEVIETLNGYHIISAPFKLDDFRKTFTYDVHKDNPTVLYIS